MSNNFFEVTNVVMTALGAVFGWYGNHWISYFLNRPRVKVELHNVFLNLDLQLSSEDETNLAELNDNQFIKVPENFRDNIRKCEFIPNPTIAFLNRYDYLEYLVEMKKRIELREIREANAVNILSQLEINLNTNMMDQFIDNWISMQDVFNERLCRGFLLGEGVEIKFDPKIEEVLLLKKSSTASIKESNIEEQDGIKTDLPLYELQKIQRDKNNRFVFHHKKQAVYFKFPEERDDIRDFGRKILAAIVLKDRENLLKILEYLKMLSWNDANLREVKELIIHEIEGFKKIVVKGMIVNSGRTPIAIRGQAELIIKATGFKFYYNGKVLDVKEDIRIPISVIDEETCKHQNTLVIDGGKAITFIAQSYKYLSELESNLSITLKAMYNMERECYIECCRLDNSKLVLSNEIKYKSFNENDISIR